MRESNSKITTVSLEKDVAEQLNNLIIVVNGVPVKKKSDKIRYLLYQYEHNQKK